MYFDTTELCSTNTITEPSISTKWISQIKWSWKEKERKKKQVAEVFILYEWFTFSFGDMKNYDICYLGMRTDGVKV